MAFRVFLVLQRGFEPRNCGASAAFRLIRFAQKTLRVLVSVGSNLSPPLIGSATPVGVADPIGAPAGIRTPDTLLKRQVLCLLSYWGVSAGRVEGPGPGKKRVSRLTRQSRISRVLPNRSPAKRVRFGKGRRKLRHEAEQLSSDVVAGMAGLEPTISESKSGVLPLHYIPISQSIC